MSDAIAAVTHVWPWVASTAAVLGASLRWWRSRSTPTRKWNYEDTEEVIFPRASPSSPGRGIARLLSSPLRLKLKEDGEQAMKEEMAGLRDDVKRQAGDNAGLRTDLNRVLADNRRLRAERDGAIDSGDGSTATGTTSPPPSRRPRPRSSR